MTMRGVRMMMKRDVEALAQHVRHTEQDKQRPNKSRMFHPTAHFREVSLCLRRKIAQGSKSSARVYASQKRDKRLRPSRTARRHPTRPTSRESGGNVFNTVTVCNLLVNLLEKFINRPSAQVVRQF